MYAKLYHINNIIVNRNMVIVTSNIMEFLYVNFKF